MVQELELEWCARSFLCLEQAPQWGGFELSLSHSPMTTIA